MPAVIPVAAAVIGGATAAGAGAAGVGKNPYRAVNFGDTKGYNPDAFQFGGRRGGVQDYSATLNTRRQGVEDRAAFDPNYQRANQFDRLSIQARQGQQQAAGLMAARAQGLVPSIAGQQSAADIAALQQGAQMQGQQALAQQAAQQASARGPAGVALAQQNAANNVANAQGMIGSQAAMATQNISNQAQVNAANERMQAEQAAFGAYGGMRGGDVASQQQAAQQAQFGSQMQQMNRNANDARAMGYEQLDANAQLAQLQAQQNQQNMLAQSHGQATGMNMGANQANANREMQFFQAGVGAVEGAAGMGMQAGGAKSDDRAKYGMVPMRADGGPVAAGRPYIVGERGPEVIVPSQHGLVVPNEQVRDFGEVEDWGLVPQAGPRVELGQDEGYRHRTMQAEMDRELALMQQARRNVMSDTRRDSRADQRRVKDAYYAELGRKADAEMASMRANLGRGASVARYEGEVDQPSEPPTWLANSMDEQQPQRVAQGPLSDDRAKLELARAQGFGQGEKSMQQMMLGGKPTSGEEHGAPEPGMTPSGLENLRRILEQEKRANQPEPRGNTIGAREVERGRPAPFPDPPMGSMAYDKPRPDEVTSQLAHGLMPIEFEYKPGMGPPGRRPGIRAQLAEQTPITAPAITRGPDGMRRIDPNQGLSTALMGVGHLAQKQAEQQAMLTALLKGGAR